MVAIVDQFVAGATPYIGQVFDLVWMIAQLIGLLIVIGYGILLYMYDTKVNVREYSKGGRTITYSTRAMKIRDKKTGAPRLRFFGKMGFMGEVINEPPAECLVAHRSRITTKMYDFVRKDGLYYPVQNFVLGVMQNVINEKTGESNTIYSLEGSGLEVNRDYDAEQAIQNTLIDKATTYRNRKPTEIIASYALMIITIITCGVVMWFAWKQFGNMAGAIASLGPPLREGIVGAAQGLIGPG